MALLNEEKRYEKIKSLDFVNTFSLNTFEVDHTKWSHMQGLICGENAVVMFFCFMRKCYRQAIIQHSLFIRGVCRGCKDGHNLYSQNIIIGDTQ